MKAFGGHEALDGSEQSGTRSTVYVKREGPSASQAEKSLRAARAEMGTLASRQATRAAWTSCGQWRWGEGGGFCVCLEGGATRTH